MNASFIKNINKKQNETEQKLCLITTNTVTIPPYHISLVPLKTINQTKNAKIQSEALLEIEEYPEQQELVLIPTLQKLGSRVPDAYMAVQWNPGGQTVILKRNRTIGYVKESDYIEKGPQEQPEIGGK